MRSSPKPKKNVWRDLARRIAESNLPGPHERGIAVNTTKHQPQPMARPNAPHPALLELARLLARQTVRQALEGMSAVAAMPSLNTIEEPQC
jgi:hypothetical protein